MTENPRTPREVIHLMNEEVSNDYQLSNRDRELWQHMPYLFKLNHVLHENMAEKPGVLNLKVIRALIRVGAHISVILSFIVGGTQLERDMKAIKKLMKE